MSFDPDRMISSPEDSDTDNVKTPSIAANIQSPPDSRGMPTSASGSSIANSNGKRPIQTISNGNDDVEGAFLKIHPHPHMTLMGS